jgi:hypothetical protein
LAQNTQKSASAYTPRDDEAALVEKLGLLTLEAVQAHAVGGLFTQSRLDKNSLEPSPISPDWILEGNPEAKCKNLSQIGDCWTVIDHWSCTKGKFVWHYFFDETILILEGEAMIVDENGVEYLAVPGTTVSFPDGSKATWTVPEYVRKIAFNQKSVPSYLHTFCRAVNKVHRKLFR